MALRNGSVATIDSPEFINIAPNALNPGISECEIKICYLGANRNGSFISKEVAKNMAQTLPGTPIVGAYKKEKEDFSGHGEVIKIEDGQISFEKEVMPFGFVSPDAKVWFQKFNDYDKAVGEFIEREYLMTTGYLWTKYFKPAEQVLQESKGQSMELAEDTLDGYWSKIDNSEIEFFIINDADFSSLCILGDDVEPCFEGASVSKPEISKNFSKDSNVFSKTLFSMMEELKVALQTDEGGLRTLTLEDYAKKKEEEKAKKTRCEKRKKEDEKPVDEKPAEEEAPKKEDKKETLKEKEEEPSEEKPEEKEKEAPKDAPKEKEETPEKDDKKKKKNHSLEDFEALENKVASLENELSTLREFKLNQERTEKEALINKYFMLDEAEKEDVVKNINSYSYEEIESKLALAYVRKNVDFNSLGEEKEEKEVEESPLMTFSLDEESAGFVPPIVEALRQTAR